MDSEYEKNKGHNGAANAIDGKINRSAHDICGEGERWLEIDMKKPHRVGRVRVLNSKKNDNAYRFRMTGTKVTADGVDCGSMKVDNRKDQWYMMDCRGAQASKIRLSVIGKKGADQLHEGCIHVEEVEVFAVPA